MHLKPRRFMLYGKPVIAGSILLSLGSLACASAGETRGIANTLSTDASVNITQNAALLAQLEGGDVEGSERQLRRMICSDLLVLDNLTRSDALIGTQKQATLKDTMARIEQTPSRGTPIIESAECEALRRARAKNATVDS